MDIINSTDIRKNWSVTLDSVVHDKPAYIKRTHDYIALIDISTLNKILGGYKFYTDVFNEDDGSITLSMRDMDIIINDADRDSAIRRLASYIKEYAEEFYSEYNLWSNAPNRKSHIPYVFKALTLDEDAIIEEIICQDGKN